MDTKEIIDQMIDKIIDGNNTGAKEDFESLISQKLDVAIDAKKQEVAASIYASNQQPEEEISIEDEEPADTNNAAV